ncbi:hypothetical protein Tco_0974989 [Tanacetum coccineum]|uniref:Uncharacterized protein n=1 Tax=Tanacetum coccineum TaxID=301880 RepID=A0ABQ5EDB6_9ASTR
MASASHLHTSPFSLAITSVYALSLKYEKSNFLLGSLQLLATCPSSSAVENISPYCLSRPPHLWRSPERWLLVGGNAFENHLRDSQSESCGHQSVIRTTGDSRLRTLSAIFKAAGEDPAQNIENCHCIDMMEVVNGGKDLIEYGKLTPKMVTSPNCGDEDDPIEIKIIKQEIK